VIVGQTNPAVLDFDHLRDKKYSLTDMIRKGYGLPSIKKEIEKCVIRCANCHRIKTSIEQNWYKDTSRKGKVNG
jgi:hypothetical protein